MRWTVSQVPMNMILFRLIETHGVKKIALGNGTASRETERMLVDLIKSDQLLNGVEYVIISEQGVSIYRYAECV